MRWLPLLVLGPVIGGLLGYLIVHRIPSTYEATVTLLVQPADTSNGSGVQDLQAAQDLAQTYAEAIHTRRVLGEAARQVGLDSRSERDLESMVTPRRVTGTQLLRVSVDDTDPKLAADFANAVAAVFVQQNTDLQASRYASSRDNLAQLVSQLQSDINTRQSVVNDLQTQAASPERDAQLAQAQNGLDQLRTTYGNTLNSYEQMRVSEASAASTVTTFDPAVTPEEPIKPNRALATLLAAVVGLVLAAAVVFLAELLDDGLRDASRIAAAAGDLPVIGAVPRGSSVTGGQTARPSAERVKSLYVLRSRLTMALKDRTVRSLMIASAASGEGKSTIAANIGIALAQADQKVILVDANLHKPALSRLFGLPHHAGFAELLERSTQPVGSLLLTTRVPNLQVLPSGALPPEPSRLLASKRLPALVSELVQQCDTLIIDTPSLLDQPDGVILSGQVDGVLFVVDAHKTRGRAAVRALEWLRSSGAEVLGLVVNRARRDSVDFLLSGGPALGGAGDRATTTSRNGHVLVPAAAWAGQPPLTTAEEEHES
jgi:non-specific protein-tyrosine kinase